MSLMMTFKFLAFNKDSQQETVSFKFYLIFIGTLILFDKDHPIMFLLIGSNKENVRGLSGFENILLWCVSYIFH